jgi:hypothetical protein
VAETMEKNNFANVDEHAESPVDRDHVKSSIGAAHIKNVQNVALADATAKQKPSLWTRRMFQVFALLSFGYLFCQFFCSPSPPFLYTVSLPRKCFPFLAQTPT